MTPAAQRPSRTGKWPVPRRRLVAVAFGAAIAAVAGIRYLSLESEKADQLQQAEQAYRHGVRLLRDPDKREALSAFDAALRHPTLSKKARTMKAATLLWLSNDAEALTTFSGETNRLESAYDRPALQQPKQHEPTLRKRIEILDAALTVEPKTKVLWELKGETLVNLYETKNRNRTYAGLLTLWESIRDCHEHIRTIDPSYQPTLNRLGSDWLKPLDEPERRYAGGVEFLRRQQWGLAIDVFEAAMQTADQEKAKVMQAATLAYLGDDGAAFAAFFSDPKPDKPITAKTPGWGERSESTLRRLLEIIAAALAIEPRIREFWFFKGDLLLQLNGKTAKTPAERNAGLIAARQCYEEALKVDPSWAAPRKRLTEPWMQPQRLE